MEVMELLTQAVEQNAADIFLVPGMPFSYKIGGRIICQGEEKIMPDQMNQMITRIYEIARTAVWSGCQVMGMMIFPLPFPECPGSGRMFSAREVPWQQ